MLGLILIIIISLNQSLQDCIIDNRSPENAWEQKLQRDLRDKPEILEIPCGPRGVEANVSFVLKYFNYDSNEGLFMIYSWVFLSWNNDKLTWNPGDYGGLNETLISNRHMWYPQLRLFNGLGSIETVHFFVEPCKISSNGNGVCVYRIVDRVTCVSDLTKWPYDTQSCSLKLGLWENRNKTLRLRTNSRAITMIGADYGAEYDIIDYKQEENQGAEVQLKMTFVIERHAENLAAMLIFPSIALTTLSIASFTLDVRRIIRFGLVCFNLANHFSFMMELQEHVPYRSVYPPTILLFYRGSMLINMVLVLFTYVLGVMCKRQKVPPVWVCSVNDVVFKGRGKFLVWPIWDSEVGTNEFSEQWTQFAIIINNVFFIVIIIVYVCLYFVYMPQPRPLNY